MTTKIGTAMIVAIVVGGLVGCSVDKILGYEYCFGDDVSMSVRYSVKSSGVNFGKDKVVLEFGYGCSGNSGFQNPFYDTDKEALCVYMALCFYDGQYFSEGYYQTIFVKNDYRDIAGYYFIKTISLDEFNSDQYHVTLRTRGGNIFNHREMLFVPEDVFERAIGSFVFQVVEIWFSEADNCYAITSVNALMVNYEHLDEQTILLSKPSCSTPR